MKASTTIESAPRYWSEEPANRPDRARIRARIGGLHCSLCTGTIEKALGRQPGVDKVAVSLTHEQALIEYDPRIAHPEDLLETLKDIGYTISDPRKLRPFEEEEAALVREGRRFLAAVGCSLAAIALVAHPEGFWSTLLSVVVFASLLVFVVVVLRARGLITALGGAAGLAGLGVALHVVKTQGWFVEATPWITGALAVVLVFGIGNHILVMALQALKRGILNQHVLLEIGAFAGIAGGLIGLIVRPEGYPTAPFFAVAVMVATYHIFSEWLSLIVKTRSSQAVKKLLDLQPETARVVRNNHEVEMPIEQVQRGDQVRIRPGERFPVDGEVLSGHSAVDESFITGEPIPVEKAPGSQVIGGAINREGTLVIRVTAIGEETFLQHVIRHVEDARALKPGLLQGEPPSDADIAAVLQTIRRRVIRTLRHLGYLEAGSNDAVATGYDPLRSEAPELARTLAASVTQRIAFGERAGQHVRRIGAGFGYEGERPERTGPRCASVNGFSLHANTQVPAHRRDQLERLIRYRPNRRDRAIRPNKPSLPDREGTHGGFIFSGDIGQR